MFKILDAMSVTLFTWHHGLFEAIHCSTFYFCDYLPWVFFTSCLTFCRSLRAFLLQRNQGVVIGRRPTLKSCKGGSCQGECGQGVACDGWKERPVQKHHLLVRTPLLTTIQISIEIRHRSSHSTNLFSLCTKFLCQN